MEAYPQYPPPDDKGLQRGFLIGLGGCAGLSGLTYALAYAEVLPGEWIILLMLIALLGLPLAVMLTGLVVLLTGRTRWGTGLMLGGVAGFLVGAGLCATVILTA